MYGLSHIDMFRDLQNVTTMVYADTDSAIIDSKEVKLMPIGKNVREYKVEHSADSVAIIGKKSYCMVGKTIRTRLKGYKPGQKWEAVEKKSGEVVLKGDDVSIDIFNALASQQHDVYTIQENLVKNAIRKSGKEYELFTIKSKIVRKKLV